MSRRQTASRSHYVNLGLAAIAAISSRSRCTTAQDRRHEAAAVYGRTPSRSPRLYSLIGPIVTKILDRKMFSDIYAAQIDFATVCRADGRLIG